MEDLGSCDDAEEAPAKAAAQEPVLEVASGVFCLPARISEVAKDPT